MATKHLLPILPYSYDALEPFIDARTMEIHHTKHHQAYVDKLNLALEKYPVLFKKPLKELISDIASIPEDIRTTVRNHGGGHFNHSLFWTLMTPSNKGRVAEGKIVNALVKQFGSIDAFKQQFTDAALNRFGSGWAWLVLHNKNFEIYSTPNQDSPLFEGKIPLIGLDVWEHAYYLKYQQKRADYIAAWWNVLNWHAVETLYHNA